MKIEIKCYHCKEVIKVSIEKEIELEYSLYSDGEDFETFLNSVYFECPVCNCPYEIKAK